jgi:predicted MFS family arabinose efflux permease
MELPMSDTTQTLEATAARALPFDDAPSEAAWPAVVALAFGVFGLVTGEFLPASLLTPIAGDLGISNGTAGQAVTVTALVAGVAGPGVVLGAGRVDRRLVVLALSLLLIASNLMAAAASSVWMLLAARVGLGIALGAFWSLAAALALRLVPAHLMPRAMSVIFTGVSAATVCAAPLGTYLGDLWGWRATFVVAAAIGLLAFIAQLVTLPRLPPATAPTLGSFLVVLRRPSIQIGLVTVILVMSGHFAGFTYIRPFLEQVPRLDVHMISLVLLAFGLGGFLGNFASGLLAERSAKLAIGLASLGLAATAALLLAFGTSFSIALVATAAWGFAFAAFPIGAQTWTTQSAPDYAESAGALLLTTFQIAIASGAVVGGLLVDRMGASGVIGYCSLAALTGGLAMLGFSRRMKTRGW